MVSSLRIPLAATRWRKRRGVIPVLRVLRLVKEWQRRLGVANQVMNAAALRQEPRGTRPSALSRSRRERRLHLQRPCQTKSRRPRKLPLSPRQSLPLPNLRLHQQRLRYRGGQSLRPRRASKPLLRCRNPKLHRAAMPPLPSALFRRSSTEKTERRPTRVCRQVRRRGTSLRGSNPVGRMRLHLPRQTRLRCPPARRWPRTRPRLSIRLPPLRLVRRWLSLSRSLA